MDVRVPAYDRLTRRLDLGNLSALIPDDSPWNVGPPAELVDHLLNRLASRVGGQSYLMSADFSSHPECAVISPRVPNRGCAGVCKPTLKYGDQIPLARDTEVSGQPSMIRLQQHPPATNRLC
jgi:hypothetical protein